MKKLSSRLAEGCTCENLDASDRVELSRFAAVGLKMWLHPCLFCREGVLAGGQPSGHETHLPFYHQIPTIRRAQRLSARDQGRIRPAPAAGRTTSSLVLVPEVPVSPFVHNFVGSFVERIRCFLGIPTKFATKLRNVRLLGHTLATARTSVQSKRQGTSANFQGSFNQ